jgi:hypothetical protein
MLDFLPYEDGADTLSCRRQRVTTRRCVMSQKSADLKCTYYVGLGFLSFQAEVSGEPAYETLSVT